MAGTKDALVARFTLTVLLVKTTFIHKFGVLSMTTLFNKGLLGILVGGLMAISLAPIAAAQTEKLSVTVSGTLSGPSAGQCGGNGYADQCSGDNSTPCENFSPGTPTTKIKGIRNKPRASGLCITVDPGNNPNEPNNLDGTSTCSPIYGQFSAQGTGDSGCIGCFTDFNFAGVLCHHQGNSAVGLFEGGYAIGAASTPTTGWGTLSGTLNNSTGAFTIKLEGTGTP